MATYFSQCIACKSTKIKKLETYKTHYLVRCKNCHLVFAQKIPLQEELDKIYSGYSRNDYLSPITIKRYHELLHSFKKYQHTNRIIDVGCGIGYFLECAIEQKWDAHGTEYTEKTIEICNNKGIKMQQGELNVSNYQSNMFDVVTSFEVIEHINNPLDEIMKFRKILRKNGLLYITTPNFNSLLRYFLKNNYTVINYPEHLSYYTPKSLKKLLKDNGFKIVSCQTTGISLTRLLKTKKHISTSQTPKTETQNKSNTQNKPIYIAHNTKDETLRKKIEKNKILKVAKGFVNYMLTLFGVGDTIKIYAEKM